MAQTERELTASEKARDFLLQWHQLGIDYWWRKKYNVPFGSSKHREMSPIDMYIEYQEEELLKEMQAQAEREEHEREMRSIGAEGSNEVEMSQEEIDEEFDNLDLSEFDQ